MTGFVSIGRPAAASTTSATIRGLGFRTGSGLHNSCATLRRLKHAAPSELHEPFFAKPMDLLSKIDGIEFVTPARPDECCGFGGTFSVFEEVVSTKMGYDKITDHARAGAEYIVSADTSCRCISRTAPSASAFRSNSFTSPRS